MLSSKNRCRDVHVVEEVHDEEVDKNERVFVFVVSRAVCQLKALDTGVGSQPLLYSH